MALFPGAACACQGVDAAGACKRFVWILCVLQCTVCCFLAWRVLTCKVQQCPIGVLVCSESPASAETADWAVLRL